MKHYEYEISMFADNELDDDMQAELFAHLAHCGECRKELADTLALKEKVKAIFTEDIKQMKAEPAKKKINYKAPFYAAAAAAVIFMFLFINTAPDTVEVMQTQVIRDTVYVNNTPDISPALIAVKEEKPAPKRERAKHMNADAYYLEYIQSLPGVKLTSADRIEKASGKNL